MEKLESDETKTRRNVEQPMKKRFKTVSHTNQNLFLSVIVPDPLPFEILFDSINKFK